MTWEIFLGIAALVAFAISIIAPIVKLTSAVTKLSCAVNAMNQNFEENKSVTTKRLDAHGKKLDELDGRVGKTEQAYEHIKEKVDFFHHN